MDIAKKITNLKPVYQIKGDDAFLMHETLKEIENLCENNLGDINKSVFDDENFNADKIILACEQIPLMAKKRTVIIKNILKVKDNDLKKLTEYCRNPVPDTVLVFLEVVGLNIFGKVGAEKILCKKLSSIELQKIIKAELIESQKTINNDAMELLINYCSSDLQRIKNELLKLVFASDNKEITKENVVSLVQKSDEFGVFEICDALTYGNSDKAIFLMKNMLENMEFPIILNLIYSHFRKMFYIAISEDENSVISHKLGVQEYSISISKNKLKNIKKTQIIKIIDIILNVDYDIKNGKMALENAMYFLVFGIVKIIKGE